MKFLFQFLFLIFVNTVTNGQIDEEEIDLNTIFPESVMSPPDGCLAPVMTNVSVLQFSTYAEAQVSIYPAHLATTIYYKIAGSGEEYLTATVSEKGESMIYKLDKEKPYVIAVRNLCGKITEIGIIDATTEFEGVVTVSEKLHYELNRYLKEEPTTKLTDFLRNLTTVSLFERVSFVQRFFFKGTPLIDFAPIKIPEISVPSVCFCNSIITTQLAIPAALQFVSSGSGNVEAFTQSTSGGNPNPQGSNGSNNNGTNSRKWHWLNNKGPGKYHQAWTEGFKAKFPVNHEAHVGWDRQETSGISSQKSYIRTTLICLDGDELPAECGCEKDIEFGYRYDTRVTAHAHLVSGTIGTKKAWAQAEDMYTVVFEDESLPLDERYQVLDMGVVRSASACDWSVNPDFWTNKATLLADAAKLYLAYSATQNVQAGQQPSQTQQDALTNSITSFASTLGTAFTTPVTLSTGCNNDDDKFGGVFRQSIQKTFKPNATITLTMSSYDKISSGGRRAWHSHGRVLSGHFLTGVVKPNAYDNTPVHCCSPKLGMWLVGHCGGSTTEDQLKVEAADLLYHNGIVNLINTPAGISVVDDFGYTVQASSLEQCNQIVVNPTVSGGRSNESEIKNDVKISNVQIYDVNGRLVKSFQWSGGFSNSDLIRLKDRHSNLQAGIYFVLVDNGNGRENHKLFIY
jgi:hypothetical protein